MSRRTYEEIKESFKQSILDLEEELLNGFDKTDSQQAVNKIVKKFDEEAAEDLAKEINNEN